MFLTSKTQIREHRLESKRAANSAIQIARNFRNQAGNEWKFHAQLIDRETGVAARRKSFTAESREFQKKLAAMRDESRPMVSDVRAKLATLKADIAASREFVGSAQSYLQALNIGSDKRAKYLAEVSGMGRAALSAMAIKARSDKDRDLAAALLIANDRLPKDGKAFDAVAFAREFVGAEVDELQAELNRTEMVIEATELGLSKALGEQVSSTGFGLKFRNYQAAESLEADEVFDKLPEIWRNISTEELIPSQLSELGGGDSMRARDAIKKGMAAKFGGGADDEEAA